MVGWMPCTLGELLANTAERVPEQEALVIDGERVTYAQLETRVTDFAKALRALGVRRGDHVAVCMGNCVDWVVAFYAAATIGAVTVPVNTRFKAEELRYCLAQADVKVLFIADRFLNIDFIDMLRAIAPAVDTKLPDPALPLLCDVIVRGSDVPLGALALREAIALGTAADDSGYEDPTVGDVLLMQFTSGTTSHPKGVMLTHENMLRNAAAITERFNLQEGDRYYGPRPFYHVAGTTLSLLATLTRGACLVASPTFEPGEALQLMQAERCTHVSGNDTIFLMLMNHPDYRRDRLALRHAWASAGTEVSRQIVERMGLTTLCHAYGLSEAAPNVWMSRYDDVLEKRIAGWGHPLEDLDVRIADTADGRDLGPGQKGEVQVRGWSVMKGYYKMPEQTAAAIDADGWLHTGDLGEMDEDGRFRFVTRIKDVFRVGGENVAPAEVEEVLQQHPAVKQAQVVGVPDPRLIEVPAAYIVLKPGASLTAEEMIAWSRSRMANFRVPRYVKIIDTFETIGMTGSAKVQKNKLREQALKDFAL